MLDCVIRDVGMYRWIGKLGCCELFVFIVRFVRKQGMLLWVIWGGVLYVYKMVRMLRMVCMVCMV